VLPRATVKTLVLVTALSVMAPAWSEAFRVTTLRAAPGKLSSLIDEVRRYRDERRGRVIVMRHSQGDHWDLMLLEPVGADLLSQPDFSAMANFQHTFYAQSGSSFKGLQHQAEESGLYHVEMFRALAGKRGALVDQRRRENSYLDDTGQPVNVIFTTLVGSDVDVFTVGFHKDLAAFAHGPAVTDEEAERAAREAGFAGRGDIGLYLRSLLTAHRDTLAVPVD
jgi:hypothetical protein